MSTYVIGDLQGCFEELQKLLTTVQFREDRDALWLCGDIVNRGPESLKCLSYLYSIRENCKIVLGNHDLHLLGIIEGSRSPTESDTLEEVLESSDLIILAEWMKTLPYHHIEKVKSDGMEIEFIMTHAGVPPSWTKQDLLERSEELSKYLSNANSENFLNNIFGNYPNLPNECKSDIERLRLNINYITRMRYFDEDGSLDLKFKGRTIDAPINLKPWFEYESKILNEETHLLFGHWAALEGFTGKNNISALDTGCAWGNKLTALRLEDKTIFSCDKLN